MGDKMLSPGEQETIINFNREDKLASIFTYDKTWQKHLESKLGLKPLYDNGFGGREYEIDKKRIKPPRAFRKLSSSARKKLGERLHASRVLRPLKHSSCAEIRKVTNKVGKKV